MIDFASNTLIEGYFDNINSILLKQEETINYTGNYKKRENRIIAAKYLPKKEISDYQKSFIEFPLSLINTQANFDINHYFYEYYSIGQYSIDISNITPNETNDIFKYDVPEYVEKPKSAFLFSVIRQKYGDLIDNYPSNLKSIAENFNIIITNEKLILINTIKFYTKILNSKDEQLKLFEAVLLTKEISDLFTNILIEFLKRRLELIEPNFEELYFQHKNETNYENSEDVVSNVDFTFPPNFNPNKLQNSIKNLTRKQAVLLFYFLRKKGAIINYNDTVLSEFISYLTGFSKNTIRNEKGLGDISAIIDQEVKEQENFNAEKLKLFLKEIISELDKSIKK